MNLLPSHLLHGDHQETKFFQVPGAMKNFIIKNLMIFNDFGTSSGSLYLLNSLFYMHLVEGPFLVGWRCRLCLWDVVVSQRSKVPGTLSAPMISSDVSGSICAPLVHLLNHAIESDFS